MRLEHDTLRASLDLDPPQHLIGSKANRVDRLNTETAGLGSVRLNVAQI